MEKEYRPPAVHAGQINSGGGELPESIVDTLSSELTDDPQRLLHELQVHQVELEAQNQELRRAREELEATTARYADLYDFSPVAYFTLDRTGTIREANLTGASLLGVERSRLIGRVFPHFLPVNARPSFSSFLNKVFSGEAKVSCELALNGKKQSAQIVLIEAVPGHTSLDCRLAVIDITERKLMEEALRDSEERYRRLFEVESDAVFILEHETLRFLDANVAAREMYGYSLDEFLRMTPMEISAEPEKTLRSIAEKEFQVPYRLHRKKDGTEFPVEISGSNFDYRGRVVHVFAIRDITERVSTERIMNARLRLLQFATSHSLEELLQKTLDEVGELNGSPIGFYHFVAEDQRTLLLQVWSTGTLSGNCNPDGKRRHRDMTGAGVGADVIRKQRPMVHNDYSSLPDRMVLPKGHPEVERLMVVPVFRGDRIVALLGQGNKPGGYDKRDVETVTLLADMAWDMVEQKLAEKEIIEAKESFESFFNLIPGLACIGSTDGFFMKMNPNWEHTMGYKIEELQNTPFIDFVHPEDMEHTLNSFERLVSSGSAIYLKNRFRHRDGTYRWLEWEAIQVMDSGLVYATARDITDIIRLEEEARLNQARLIQANKMASLGVIASGVAHEINNPNNYILSNASLLAAAFHSAMPILEDFYRENGDFKLGDLQYSSFRENAARLFSGVVEGAQRISGIVARLKDFAQQDAGNSDESFDVNRMIVDVMFIIEHEVKKHCDNFRFEAASGLPPAQADSRQIGQVIINLLLNAIQALPDRSRSIRIVTGPAEDGKHICISIEDEGVGIPPEAVERVCEPFFTTKRAEGGTGLGLSISASILKENLGTLSFSSEPGKGTTVTVMLRTSDKKEQEIP
jgi:PAS domain S-box-containing protein